MGAVRAGGAGAVTRPVPSGRVARGSVMPPPSKSVTHRVANLALLANRPLAIERPLAAEDTELFFGVLEALGSTVSRQGDRVGITPGVPVRQARLYCGNAGTLYRFLVASLTTRPGRFQIDGSPRLRERPIGRLVDALAALGAEIRFLDRPGFAPLEVAGGTLAGGRVRVDAGESSQYLSALLMAGLAARGPVEIEVGALTSAPYVELTLEAIRTFGGRVEGPAPGLYRVWPGLAPPATVRVEGDYSAAAYPAAAAVLTGGEVILTGLDPASAQGDRAFLELLARMGAEVEGRPDGFRVAGRGALEAIEADLSAMPDQVPTVAALAVFARGTTRIGNVPHLRLKESDRLAALATELARVGATVREEPDGLVIEGVWADVPPPSDPVVVDPWNDHRIAMSLALVGLRRPGISIAHAETVGKSYPGFWADLDRLLGEAPER
ncbi:MAG TPA: 3-phosphoshikimate 1-carboxyvinyltransferase [Thermoanaerobaculia bacterium]|nr:3-phosphoshikimate 1-carboxyvinyltransferase [Thermoanaerobaculia bacterium]